MAVVAAQLVMGPILEHADAQLWKRAETYLMLNRALYLAMAGRITPSHESPTEVRRRIVFSILSANVVVAQAVQAMRMLEAGLPVKFILRRCYGIVPCKLEWASAIPLDENVLAYLRRAGEPWHDYRLRLQASVRGLGLTKASYAACLLYPLEADVCCLDTWMLKALVRAASFVWLRPHEYFAEEARVRELGRRAGVSANVAQWAVWDMLRGSVEDQTFLLDGSEVRA